MNLYRLDELVRKLLYFLLILERGLHLLWNKNVSLKDFSKWYIKKQCSMLWGKLHVILKITVDFKISEITMMVQKSTKRCFVFKWSSHVLKGCKEFLQQVFLLSRGCVGRKRFVEWILVQDNSASYFIRREKKLAIIK